MKAGLAAAAGLAGLAAVLGAVAALSSLSTGHAEPRADWRPPCARHQGWNDVDVEIVSDARPRPETGQRTRWVLFGLDMSPSNRALAEVQLEEIAGVMASLPAQVGTSALLVSDRSDLSSTPDLPLQAPVSSPQVQITGLPCWPDCPTESLAAQSCFSQLRQAVEARHAARSSEADATRDAALATRTDAIDTWRAEVADWHPARPGTSLLRFFDKVADLPPVRRDPAGVTLFLLSDLEEARTSDRRIIQRVMKHHERHGTCPLPGDDESGDELPDLEGLSVVLVQSVQPRVDATRWAERWQVVLGCAGADVAVRRYSSAVPLRQLVADPP